MSVRKCRICEGQLERLYVNCENPREGWFICDCGAVNPVTLFNGQIERRKIGRPFGKEIKDVRILTISPIKETVVEAMNEELEEVLAL